MNITIRLEKLEKTSELFDGQLPDTEICRLLSRDSGMEWCLGIGGRQQPKLFFYGKTIENCIDQAENVFGIKND